MNTLSSIIEHVQNGDKPEYEELLYAVCALNSLISFDNAALVNLAHGEPHDSRAVRAFEDHFNRNKVAFEQSPKTFIGWDNDPANPDFLIRRQVSEVPEVSSVDASEPIQQV